MGLDGPVEQRMASSVTASTPQRTSYLSHALKIVVSCIDMLYLFRKILLGQKSKAIEVLSFL